MELYYYLMFWLIFIGLCMGSFFNVVILRSLSGESIVFPPSKCPKCGNKLYFWHNIPVLSYIFLKGKCYFCKEKISIQYPIIEILTMLLYLFAYLKFGLSWTTLFIIIVLSCMLIMTVTDLKAKLLDANIVILMGIVGLIYYYFHFHEIMPAIYGMLAAILIFELIANLGYLFVKSRAMGDGDTYVAAALGACFGITNLSNILIYTLVAAMIITLPMFFYKQFKNNNFGTFISGLLFIISLILFKLFFENYLGLVFVLLTSICFIFFIMKNIGKTENQTYLPFIPALTLGTLYFIFFNLKL